MSAVDSSPVPPLTPRVRSSPRQVAAGPSRSPTNASRMSHPPSSPLSSPVTRSRRGTISTGNERMETAGEGVSGPAPPAMVPEETGPKYLQPSEFYPLNNGAGGKYVPPYNAKISEWISPEDDPEAKRGIPIFRPTMEEFKDFEGYVSKTVPWGQYSGIAKIIPPDEWTGTLPPISKRTLSDVRIKNPIQQTMLGRSGLFRVTNVEKRKAHPLDIQEWFDMCQSKKFVGPGPKDGDRTLDRDSKEAKERRQQVEIEIKAKRLAQREKLAAAKQRKLAREQAAIKQDVKEEETIDGTTVKEEPVPELAHSPHSSSSSSDQRAVTPNCDTISSFYKDFDPATAWLPPNTTQEDYTPEACAVMEKKFWKTLLTREPSWYGADLQGSLFADKDTPWNVSCLPNLLNRCSLTKELPGVNSPYLYFGMYGATFAWHVEDMDLFSINYIHFGAPKLWYAVPQRHAERFENALAGYFPQDAQRCGQFLRHKSFTMSPSQLANDKIPVNMLVHKQNEFVITYPRGYHAGFNMGFNCAESINFALESWLELGRRAKVCACVEFSVRIDVDEMLAERNLEKELVETIEEERKMGRPRKRKTLESGDDHRSTPKPRIKIIRQNESGVHVEEEIDDTTLSIPVNGMETKKRRIKIVKENKPVIIQETPSYPCLFCPSLSTESLRPIHNPTNSVRAHSQSKDENLMAHHDCALGIPEVGIQDLQVDGQAIQHIINTDSIDPARWKLKCQCCQDKKLKASGAKIQCVKKSCIKAFHVSCAMADPKVKYEVYEVFDAPLVEANAEDGVAVPIQPSKRLDIHLLCELHNPDQIQLRKQEALDELKAKVETMTPGSEIKVKSKGGGSMYGKVVRTISETTQVEVEFEGGAKYFVPYDRVDFKEKEEKPKVVVENEYARQYITKAKEPIPSRSVPVPGTLSARAPAKPKQAKRPIDTRPMPVAGPSQPRPMAPPMPYPHTGSEWQSVHPRHPAYMNAPPPPNRHHPYGDYPIPNRVVNNHPSTPPQYIYPPTRPLQFYPLHHGPYPPRPQPYTAPPVNYHSLAPYPTGPLPMGWQNPAMSLSHVTNPETPSSGSQAPPTLNPGGHDRSNKIDLSLQHMQALMNCLPPIRTPAIHLAGTNGKGSVSAILESVLLVAGLRVGRYNSPHLVEPRDAIRVNGQPPSRELYDSSVATVRTEAEQRSIPVSPFELATAAAYYLFSTAQPPLDIMVIECGMGGVNDATNVIPPNYVVASALTSVGLDHTSFLGNSIGAIADQKARIAVPGGLLFTSPHLLPEALDAAFRVGYERSTAVVQAFPSVVIDTQPRRPLSLVPFIEPSHPMIRTRLPVLIDGRFVPGEDYIGTCLPLGGNHQLDNLSLALTILHVISQDKRALSIQPQLTRITQPLIQYGVGLTRWEGRCSWVRYPTSTSNPDQTLPLLVDGAHNADSAATLRHYIDQLSLDRDVGVHFIISLSDSPGKSPDSVLRPLLRLKDRVTIMDFTTPVEGMPWVKPAHKEEMREVVKAILPGAGSVDVRVESEAGTKGLQSVLDRAAEEFVTKPQLIVVCGSLYLVADVYRLVR